MDTVRKADKAKCVIKYNKWAGMNKGKLKVFRSDKINIGIYGNAWKDNSNSTNRRFKICSSPHIIWVIILQTMKRAGHVIRKGEKRNAHRVLVGKPERDFLWGLRVCGRRILKLILNIKWEEVD